MKQCREATRQRQEATSDNRRSCSLRKGGEPAETSSAHHQSCSSCGSTRLQELGLETLLPRGWVVCALLCRAWPSARRVLLASAHPSWFPQADPELFSLGYRCCERVCLEISCLKKRERGKGEGEGGRGRGERKEKK